MIRKEDEAEIQRIMQQTFTNSHYNDQQIEQFLKPTEELLILKNTSSQHDSSDNSNHHEHPYKDSFASQPQSETSSVSSEELKVDNLKIEHKDGVFDAIKAQISQLQKTESDQEIRSIYPIYLISQPKYKITENCFQKHYAYHKIKEKNIQIIDVGYCKESLTHRIAIATDQGQLIVFQPQSKKPIICLQAFSKESRILSIKWSKNLQYLAASSDSQQVKVYMFKQQIQIQNHSVYRVIKNPIQYSSVNYKKLSHSISDIYFIQQNPLQILLVDQEDQIILLEFKKHIINIKPYLSLLPVKFTDIYELTIKQIKDNQGNCGYFLAVSNVDFVTLCLLKPQFEIVLVYDKQKHGPNNKNGFPHVSFNSTDIMIIWDKFVEIINIDIESVVPLRHRMEVKARVLLPQNTIIGGFFSDTLIYQVSRTGFKVYSINKFNKLEKNDSIEPIYQKSIDYQWIPHGYKILESLNNHHIGIDSLRLVRGILVISNKVLFISTNTSLQTVRIQQFEHYISNMIENINNWKIGLQILHDAYKGIVYQFDGITNDIINKKITEYSLRYVNFLQAIIQGSKEQRKSLWNQQILFLFHILISTNQIKHLIKQLLPKLAAINIEFLQNLIPFILSKKINYLKLQTFELLLNVLDRAMISKLIFSIDPQENELDLSHQLNSVLLQQEYYLQLIELNNKFGDKYSAIALLIAKYSAKPDSLLAKYIGYSSFIFLQHINKQPNNNNTIKINQSNFQWYLPLLGQQINKILLKQSPIILFDWILPQLFNNNCLQILNSLSNRTFKFDLMSDCIQKIMYNDVVDYGCQQLYWVRIFDLFSRKIIKKQIWVGLIYLTTVSKINTQIIDKIIINSQSQLLKQFKTLSTQTLKNYYESILESDYISLIKLLGILLAEHISVLHRMLASPYHRNEKLYNFLEEISSNLNQRQLLQLKSIIKQYIKLFTSINPHKAANLIIKHYSNSMEIFVNDLEEYPHLQLQLVQEIVLNNSNQISDHLKILFLKLLAITDQKDKILAELQKQSYPIDQSMQICQRYHVLDGQAYLLIKSGGEGETAKAIELQFQILWDYLIDNVQYFSNRLIDTVQKCVKVCADLDIRDKHHYEQEWFIIMQQLQIIKRKAYTHLTSQESEKVRCLINEKAYPQFVKSLISNITNQNIVQYLKISIDRFDIEAVRIIIQQLIKSYIYERQVLQTCQEVYIESELRLRKLLISKERKGFSTKGVCSVCGELQNGILIHYYCRHQIHPFCGNDVKQCLVCSQSINNTFQKRLNFLNEIKPTVYSQLSQGFLESPRRHLNRQAVYNKFEQYQKGILYSYLY